MLRLHTSGTRCSFWAAACLSYTRSEQLLDAKQATVSRDSWEICSHSSLLIQVNPMKSPPLGFRLACAAPTADIQQPSLGEHCRGLKIKEDKVSGELRATPCRLRYPQEKAALSRG